jgi:hypothetical protein
VPADGAPDRPSIEPGVLAAITTRAPARLVKKLDEQPELATKWRWTHTSAEHLVVETESGERVSIAGARVEKLEQLTCSCLLAPKCLHLLAVARALPLSSGAKEDETVVEASAPIAEAAEVTDAGREAARRALRASANVIEAGANGAGALVQAELLAAIHACRAQGLHRIASAGLRVVHGIRATRERLDTASLGELTVDLADVIAAATHVARSEPVAVSWVGTARRTYHPVGALRVHGLFTEGVATKSGHAGVVTHVVDANGTLSTVPDVLPGDETRARGTYESGIDVGDATLSHRELAREGLFLANATRSTDGRLGAGANVRAVRAGPCTWDEPVIAKLFATPLETQRARIRSALALPPIERPGGWDLVFLRVAVVGATPSALVLTLAGDEQRFVFAQAPEGHGILRTRPNLQRLARAPGLALRVVGRVVLDRPGTLELLAIGEPDPADRHEGGRVLQLPSTWHGRACLGHDAIEGAMITGDDLVARFPVDARADAIDPLAPLRRRVQRAAIGGRATLRVEEGSVIASEQARLEKRLMPSAAALLGHMLAAATTSSRDASGARRKVDPARFAEAWARAAMHERAASVDLALSRW